MHVPGWVRWVVDAGGGGYSYQGRVSGSLAVSGCSWLALALDVLGWPWVPLAGLCGKSVTEPVHQGGPGTART